MAHLLANVNQSQQRSITGYYILLHPKKGVLFLKMCLNVLTSLFLRETSWRCSVPGCVQIGMFCSCEHLYLIWLGLSSAVVFQVLTAAAGICSVDFTVTLISITVHTTTKLKLLTRFAKRTLWLLQTRSREYEEDSVWLWILGAMGFKKWTWAQPSSWRTCFYVLLFVTLSGFSPQCMTVHICFQLFILVCVWV